MTVKAQGGFWKRQRRFDPRSGTVMMEYLIILAVVVGGAAIVFAPQPGNLLYESIRSAYRRWIVLIGLPIL
jgi:ABC-type branched-subunit amino acid transport system permease subunit